MAFVPSKRRGIYIVCLCFACWITLHQFSYNRSSSRRVRVKDVSLKNRSSVGDIQKEIAMQLKLIFLADKNSGYQRFGTKILSNPDQQQHVIKPNKEIAIKETALDSYLKMINETNKNKFQEILTLNQPLSKQPPSSEAVIFMEDLPYRWNPGKYLLQPWKIEKRFPSKQPLKHQCFIAPEKQWSMVALVKSWVINRNIRDAIRNTWGRVLTIAGVEIHVVFLLARASKEHLRQKVEEENNVFGDILQVDAAEELKFFTERSVSGMIWVGNHFPSHFIYSSLDDNVLPMLGKLVSVIGIRLKKIPKVEQQCKIEHIFPFLCGYSFRRADKPGRKPGSPWSIKKEVYPPDFLPPHCQGGLYSTSVSTVNLLVDVATKTYPYHNDAVWLTGILRQKLGLKSDSIEDISSNAGEKLLLYYDKNIANEIVQGWNDKSDMLTIYNVKYREENSTNT